MFNALNRFISRLDGDHPQQQRQDRGSFGFQVLRNTNLELAVEPWFEFIVGINGRPLDNSDPGLFAQEVRNCAGSTVTLGLWNAKGQRTREMHAPVPADTASLGLSLQYSPLALAANIWHVLDVPTNSPADLAGLLPYSDYILGSPEGALYGESGLGELVEDYIGRPLRLYVYNNEYNVTREVTIQPSRDWGGQGALGCVLGYGALHRLPAPLSEPVDAPGEMMFDGEPNEKTDYAFVPETTGASAPPPAGDFLVPAQMVASGPVSAPPKGSKKKERHGHSPNRLMDDYFKEEEEKSRELDNAPKGKGTGVPPPPKAGGPPTGPPKTGTPQPEAASGEE
ncbi:Fc.00g062310.m01.CDS01 [Cosmosporella sp. VM-42]